MALFRCGISGGDIKPELIGTKTVASTSTVTFNLDKSLADYEYIYVTGGAYDDASSDTGDTSIGKNLIYVPYLRGGNTVTSHFTSGNTGSMYDRTQVMTYVNDTQVTIKNSSSVSRVIKIYGIKWNRSVSGLLNLDLSAPSYVWQGNLSGNATKTIATATRAKVLLAVRARYGDSGGNNVSMLWDEVSQKGYTWNYTSSGYVNEPKTTPSSFTISDTSVVFTNLSGYTQRCSVLIWC